MPASSPTAHQYYKKARPATLDSPPPLKSHQPASIPRYPKQPDSWKAAIHPRLSRTGHFLAPWCAGFWHREHAWVLHILHYHPSIGLGDHASILNSLRDRTDPVPDANAIDLFTIPLRSNSQVSLFDGGPTVTWRWAKPESVYDRKAGCWGKHLTKTLESGKWEGGKELLLLVRGIKEERHKWGYEDMNYQELYDLLSQWSKGMFAREDVINVGSL